MKHFWMLFLLAPLLAGSQTLFTKVTDLNNPVVTFTNNNAPYKGLAWIDLNDDNLPDLFASHSVLFQNNGNGQFAQLPNVNGATAGQGAGGVSWGDIDNDGDMDCITASLGSGLLLNNGDQTFSVASAQLPGFGNYSAWDCALVDADNNGRLDLLFLHANNFHATGPFPCRFYLQDSAGIFSNTTGYVFTDQLAPYTIPIWADYDLDGDMDLFIGAGPAGLLGPDFCYKNMLNETGSFSLQRLTDPPFNALQDGQTYNFPDFDNDGDLDICLTNYTGANNRFWRNDNGVYVGINTPFTVLSTHLANVWGDIDNDGDLDVLITSDAAAAVRLYRNKGDGSFDLAKTAGTGSNNICGLAMADYDNDGDLDFYTNGALGGRGLYRNDTLANGRNWAYFTMQGVQSNRSAIGATIRIKAQIGAQSVWQIRQVQAHNSFQSQNDLRQHFGLNNAAVIDSVEVRWPSGLTEQFAGLAVNNFYKIIEGQGINVLTQTKTAAQENSIRILPNPVSQSFRVEITGLQTAIKNIQVFDTSGRLVEVETSLGQELGQVRFGKNTAPGVYFVQVQLADGHRFIQQVIRQ